MRINGVWVGWGLGDWSHNPDGTDRDPTVRRVKAYMRAMFRSYAGNLADTNVFDLEMDATVREMQRRYTESGRLTAGQYIPGVLDLPTQVAMGWRKPANPVLPIIFTVEGHMSNMFVGPCAFVASTLEAEQRCHWKPIGYNNTALPFDNASGIDALYQQLVRDTIEGPPGPDGRPILWPFPAGTPWEILIFSQGGIVGSEFMMRHIIPDNGSLHWRYKDFRRGLAFGNPYREKDQVADWVPDPPRPGTQGISDKRINTTQLLGPDGRPLSNRWREHARHGDLYAENEDNEVGLNKTAVYKMVQKEFTGRQTSILARIGDLFNNPLDGVMDIGKSVLDGGMFVANMGPHGTYDLGPDVNWMRDGLAA